MDWQPIHLAPFGPELELCVIERGEIHSLAFPCRRTAEGWRHVGTSEHVFVQPTHWRPWDAVPRGR